MFSDSKNYESPGDEMFAYLMLVTLSLSRTNISQFWVSSSCAVKGTAILLGRGGSISGNMQSAKDFYVLHTVYITDCRDKSTNMHTTQNDILY
jgi:hypothetical protein